MSRDVVTAFKDPAVFCPCGCGSSGPLLRATGHPKKCKGRCCAASRAGRSNKTNGARAQRTARSSLGVPGAHTRSKLGNEENWRDPWFRFEVKSGAQVEPIATRFLAAERQADQAKSIGDNRPLALVAMPSGMGGDGLVVMRLEDWRTQIAPALLEASASPTVRFEPVTLPKPYDHAKEDG